MRISFHRLLKLSSNDNIGMKKKRKKKAKRTKETTSLGGWEADGLVVTDSNPKKTEP